MIDLIPDRYKLLAGGVVMFVALSCAAFLGWQLKAMQAEVAISSLELTHAREREQQANAALVSLKADADAVRQAAAEYAAIEIILAPKIAALTKELRSAKPLPLDCMPDAYRVRNLDAAIDAANQTIPR